jgi:hypothetical protein
MSSEESALKEFVAVSLVGLPNLNLYSAMLLNPFI